MSFSDHCCVPRFFNRGRASPSLFSHGFSRSSELRKRWLLAIRQADWSHFRLPNNTVVCIEHVLPAKNFAFMLVPKSMWTLPSPVLWNRVRLDTSRKQVLCHRCFLFTRMGPKWECEARRRRESDMFARGSPRRRLGQMLRPLTIGSWQKGSGRGCNAGEVCARRLFFFFCFRLHLEKHRGCTRNAVCMRDDDWEILGVQEARLSWTANDCVLFFSQVLFQTSDAPTDGLSKSKNGVKSSLNFERS